MTKLSLDLLLLGFPCRVEQVRPGNALFAKPNSRLLEDVLYFLLGKLDPRGVAERLCDCWPVTNAIVGKRFRADVFRWFEELRKEGIIPRECVLRKSYLDENVGERLEECLAKFAEFLIERERETMERVKAPQTFTPHVYACEAFLVDSQWNTLASLRPRLQALHADNSLFHATPQRRPFTPPAIPACKPTLVHEMLE